MVGWNAMSRTATAILVTGLAFVAACSQDMQPPARDYNGSERERMADEPTVLVAGREWRVEDIDEGGIIDRSMITLSFAEAGRVSGSGGCNRYFGSVSFEASAVEFSGIGSTRKACAPALMSQESRFFQALEEVSRYKVVDDMFLVLSDPQGRPRIRAIIADGQSADRD